MASLQKFIGAAGLIPILGVFSCLAPARAGADELEVVPVVPNLYMIVGAGGNIAVQTGPDGVVLVNAGSAEMPDKVLAAIQKLTPQPIRFIIDTSADAENVGGNAALAKAGQSFTQATNTGPGGIGNVGPATILASETVLDRMSAPAGKQAPFPADAWPTEAFSLGEKDVYINQEGIQSIHQPAAHSDGDVIVFFRRSDVLVAGDILDTTQFPRIEIDQGGSIQGEIDALNRIIQIAIPSIPLAWQRGGTLVLPGHGRVCDQADVVEYRDMLAVIRDVIQDMIHRGMTLEQIKAADPTEGYRERFGADSGPWTTDMFVEAIYKSLTANK
jgi:glyoxylase-like metal-dependent hydrolase (beta-lactamase superfamily II)